MSSDSGRHTPQRHAPGQIRIIGGQWRARKLNVAAVPGLRPTGDRVRETLFNWLQAQVAGSHCLDLFAGSGALGLEALSRYARSVTFVEPNVTAFRTLRESLNKVDCQVQDEISNALAPTGDDVDLPQPGIARLINTTAQQFLARNAQPYNIVFIDPPFDSAVQWETLAALSPGHLATDALIYVEAPRRQSQPEQLPHTMRVIREKEFGEVCVRLIRMSGA